MTIIKKLIKLCLKLAKSAFVMVLSWLFLLRPVKKNRVLFASDTRYEFTGNLKLMYDRVPDTFEKCIMIKGDRRVKRSLRDSMRLISLLATSEYIFLEDLLPFMAHFAFKKGQNIIQLWHGPGAYKRFGRGRLVENGGDVTRTHGGYKHYTFAAVSSEAVRPVYAEAFGIPLARVHATGFLRTDLFFDSAFAESKKQEYYQKYPVLKKKKVILFAPTFRGLPFKTLAEGGSYYDFDRLDFEAIYRELHNDYVFVFKWHPSLRFNLKSGEVKMPDLSQYGDFYLDLSDVPEINDLLLVTDVLVSDYSSVIFDYSLLNKPIVYFTYDREDYCADRGIYFPFEEYVYGSVAVNSEQLVQAIRAEDLCEDKRRAFFNKFMSACDGHSTEKTYNAVFNGKDTNA